MKRFILSGLILLPLFLLTTCPWFFNGRPPNGEPDYPIPIIWKSDIQRPFASMMASDEGSVYVYSYQEKDFTTVRLNRLDAETGKTVWTTGWFEEVTIYQPIITENCIYATLERNTILCFDKESGTQLARIRITRDNQDIWVTSNYYLYQNYLYFGMEDIIIDNYYLARANINSIAKDGDPQEQPLEPELLCQSRNKNRILSRPIVHNDIVYFNTVTLALAIPLEIAGIDINTKEEVFYDSFGGDRDYIIDHGWSRNSLNIKDDILYYLSQSIAAYDTKKNHKRLYHIVFDINTPKEKNYGSGYFLGAVFYNDRIYYTTGGTNYLGDTGSRNIFCINEKDGKLVWSDIPKRSESLGGKPVIYDNKVYIPHMNGIRVYNADDGKLLGVEKSIEGDAFCFNQLYGSTMVTEEKSSEYPHGQIIALDLSR